MMEKRKPMLLFLFFVMSFIVAQEHRAGNMLIMGWGFEESDTPMQTNTAINAIIRYLDAARYQMSYDVSNEPSCLMELYKETEVYDIDVEDVYIYINRRSEDNIMDRYIEFDFFILTEGQTYAERYKLILSHVNYGWTLTQSERNSWRLIMKNDKAYDFFANHIRKFRR